LRISRYVGLTTAVCFAARSLSVLGYDVDVKKVEKINSGEPTLHEPRLMELLATSLKNGFKARLNRFEKELTGNHNGPIMLS
jgi:UDP-glucose 6-dehydrogenase